jgi:uncharacterized membrane protein
MHTASMLTVPFDVEALKCSTVSYIIVSVAAISHTWYQDVQRRDHTGGTQPRSFGQVRMTLVIVLFVIKNINAIGNMCKRNTEARSYLRFWTLRKWAYYLIHRGHASDTHSRTCEKRLLATSCRSVCAPVCMEKLGAHWTDFLENWYLIIFRKSFQKIHVWLKSNKNNGYYTWRPVYIYNSISLIST